MGLFGKKESNKSLAEMTDAELLKKASRPGRDIVSEGRVIQEAAKRDLVNPKTGKAYRDCLK